MSIDTTRTVSDLGKRLREVRERRGLSVRSLAAASGVLPSTINALEVGRQQSLSPLRLVRLARAMKIPPSDLEDGLAA